MSQLPNDALWKKRPRGKTKEERIVFLSADEYTAEVRPDQVLCRACGKWVTLFKDPAREYYAWQWRTHRKRCKEILKIEASKPVENSTQKQPESLSVAYKNRTKAERMAYLEADPDIGALLPEKAYCLRCHHWVSLLKKSYYLTPWLEHTKKCVASSTEMTRVSLPQLNFEMDQEAEEEREVLRLVSMEKGDEVCSKETDNEQDSTQGLSVSAPLHMKFPPGNDKPGRKPRVHISFSNDRYQYA